MACNNALVFVKPHANNDAVNALVKEKLAAGNFKILSEGSVTGEKIDSEKIIDQHYATLARYAVEVGADQLPVPEETQKKFQEQFGSTWAELLAAGSILNAKQAAEKLGGITADELSSKWKSNDARMKLAPGLYVTKFESDGIYVINGFYLVNREKFTKPGSAVNWYSVEWTEESMIWADFRAKFIGPTNAEVAPEDSLRGIIYKDWEKLGLSEVPNVSDNGVHASAGPIEGLNERSIWTGSTVEEDVYGKQLIEAGCDLALVKSWLGNPIVEVNGVSQPVYDHLEDQQSSAVTAIIKAFTPEVAATTTDTAEEEDKKEDGIVATDEKTEEAPQEEAKEDEAPEIPPSATEAESKEEDAAAEPKEDAKEDEAEAENPAAATAPAAAAEEEEEAPECLTGLTREEFIRQMGLTTDDMADPNRQKMTEPSVEETAAFREAGGVPPVLLDEVFFRQADIADPMMVKEAQITADSEYRLTELNKFRTTRSAMQAGESPEGGSPNSKHTKDDTEAASNYRSTMLSTFRTRKHDGTAKDLPPSPAKSSPSRKTAAAE